MYYEISVFFCAFRKVLEFNVLRNLVFFATFRKVLEVEVLRNL